PLKEPLLKEPLLKEPLLKEPLLKEPLLKEPLLKEPLLKELPLRKKDSCRREWPRVRRKRAQRSRQNLPLCVTRRSKPIRPLSTSSPELPPRPAPQPNYISWELSIRPREALRPRRSRERFPRCSTLRLPSIAISRCCSDPHRNLRKWGRPSSSLSISSIPATAATAF